MLPFLKTTLLAAACATALLPASLFASPATDLLQGRLQTLTKEGLQPYDDSKLEGVKYVALYFSAEWCGPCRRFTPKLVDFYKRAKAKHPQFELVFVSRDHDEESMIRYMKTDKMQWPTVHFDQRHPFNVYKGRGIPCLVILDEQGNVIEHTYVDGKNIGAANVMESFDKRLRADAKAASEPPSPFKTALPR